MKLYLSSISGVKKWLLNGELSPFNIFTLESFYSMRNWEKPLISKFGAFLLDSGAFTFMSNAKKHENIDWLSYVDRYCDFIVENNIKLFFELDIDKIAGIRYVEMLRSRIEDKTHRKPIPVWHPSRGKDYWLNMIKEYDYVAIGGIAAKDISLAKYEVLFPWMLNQAHRANVKVHGLGYTKIEKLDKYRFDSIDSTTWTVGGQFGEISKFNKGKMERISYRKNGVKIKLVKDRDLLTLYNFKEWIKMQQYANKYL